MSRLIKLKMPPEAVFEAVRDVYARHPYAIHLDDDDLASLIYIERLLPYRPALCDVSGAVAALFVERGIDAEEFSAEEIRQAYRRIGESRIDAGATLTIGGRVVKVGAASISCSATLAIGGRVARVEPS